MSETQQVFRGPPGFGEAVEGEVLVSTEGFSPRYDLDRDSGVISRKGHAIEGKSIAGKILVVPSAKGGVAAGWAFYDLNQREIAPKALICGTTNPVFVQGCVLAGIPIMNGLTPDAVAGLGNCKRARVDPKAGTVTVLSLHQRA